MQTRPGFFRRHLRTFGALLFVCAYSVSVSFATPPTSPYQPGATLDPTCTPGSTNCSVQILPEQTGNANKYLTTDGSVTSWSTNTLVLGGNFTTSGNYATTLTATGTTTLTLPTTGTLATTANINSAVSGTTNYIPKFTGTNTIGNSSIYDNGTNVGIGTGSPTKILDVRGADNGSAAMVLYKGSNQVAYLGTGSSTPGDERGYFALYNSTGTIGIQLDTENVSYITGGNVGIGTTAPTYNLQVVGTSPTTFTKATATGGVAAMSVENDTAGHSIYMTAQGTAVAGTQFGITTADSGQIYTNNMPLAIGPYGNYNLTLGTNNAARMTILGSNGDIGVGTNAPTQKLEVIGNIAAGYTPGVGVVIGLIDAIPNNDLRSYILWGAEATFGGTNGDMIYIPRTSAPAGHRFYTGEGLATEKMRIDYLGNVGIGTTTPSTKLRVRATPASTADYFNQTIASFESDTSDGVAVARTASATIGLKVNNGRNFIIGEEGISGAMTEYFRVASGGNVGIGTTTPTGSTNINSRVLHVYSSDPSINPAEVRVSGVSGSSLSISQGTAASYLWSSGAYPLVIATDSTPRLTIDSSGNIIIPDLAGSGNRCVYADSTGQLNVKNDDCGLASGGDDMGDHTATQNIILGSNWLSGDGGNEGIRIDASGNVGVGTGSPTANLDVIGSIAATGATDSRLSSTANNVSGAIAGISSSISSMGGFHLVTVATGGTSHVTTASDYDTYLSTRQAGNNLLFAVGNVEKMRIDGTTGNVGIGTTSPGTKLAVEGSGTANEDVVRFNNQGNYASRIWLRNSGQSAYFSLGGTTPDTIVGTGALAQALAFGVNNTSPIQFYNGSPASVKMTILSDGNVGVGTTAPTNKLDVAGTGAFSGTLNANAAGGNIRLYADGTGPNDGALFMNGSNIHLSNWDGTRGIQVVASDSSIRQIGSGNVLLNGNVGIGTTSPSYKLQVQASGTNPSALEVVSAFRKSSAGGGEIAFRVHDSLVDILSTYETTPANVDISFTTTMSNASQPERMRIQASTGNVGIGTTNPSAKLEVAGNIKLGYTLDNTSRYIGRSQNNSTDVTSNYGSIGFISTTTDDYITFNTHKTGVSQGERMRIDALGNVGIGTVPNSWHSIFSTLQIGDYGFIGGRADSYSQIQIGVNAFYNGSANWVYQSSAAASRYIQDSGTHYFQRAVSGTAGNTISWLDSMIINDSGNVGIGTGTPESLTNYTIVEARGTSSDYGGIFQSVGYGGSTKTRLYSAAGQGYAGTQSNSPFSLLTFGTERLHIAAGGDVGIGTTSPLLKLKVAGDIEANNMIRATGWLLGTAAGQGAEIGVSSGYSYFFGFNRTSSAYTPTRLVGSTIDLRINDATSGLFVNGSGSVGIGNPSSIDAPLHVNGGTSMTSGWNRTQTLQATFPTLVFNANATRWAGIGYDYSATTTGMNFWLYANTNDITSGSSAWLLSLRNDGIVRLPSYGAGTLTTDAQGNITASSDERLKDIEGSFARGLAEVRNIDTVLYRWNTVSGYDTEAVYAGFIAQNIQSLIPEAVGEDTRGYLTLNDRPILAAVINAIKELDIKVQAIPTFEDQTLYAKVAEFLQGIAERGEALVDNVTTKNLCVADESGEKTCVTKAQLDMLLSGQASGGSSYTPPPAEPEDEPESETTEPDQGGQADEPTEEPETISEEQPPEENTGDIAPETEEAPQSETSPSEQPVE